MSGVRLLAALVLAPTAAYGQASPAPYTSAARYDAMGRVTGTISADPAPGISGSLPFLAVRTGYNAAGQPIKVETGTLSAWQSESVAPSAWNGFTVNRTADMLYDLMSRRPRHSARGALRARSGR